MVRAYGSFFIHSPSEEPLDISGSMRSSIPETYNACDIPFFLFHLVFASMKQNRKMNE